MKLLIVTQYFPPEVGAPQNRLFELALRLKEKGIDVEILTAMPNYPQMEIHEAYKKKKYVEEEISGLKVKRTWIYVSKDKSVIKRLLNYFSFVFSSLFFGFLKLERKDVLMVESPPLFLGITAFLLSKAKKAKLVFNVSDLWPESAEKLDIIHNRILLKLATKLEEFCYKKSALISGQTQGICKNIKDRFPHKKVYWLKNGVDIKFYDINKQLQHHFRKDKGFSATDFILFYGGIIGYAQGLDVILHAADRLKNNTDIKFVLLGNGPEKERLLKMKTEMQLENVFFYDAVPKSQMQEIITQTNATIVPLKRLDLFKGAIPSKIFENLALKKPILLGVEGEAKELFIDEGKCGLSFEPENDKDLAEKIMYLYAHPEQATQFGNNGLKYASEKFNRDIIAQEFYNELRNL
ncbi:MAG: glycosyltransferase family 4 protein [Bacteroidales bacterium]|nr:glycosyltransferase family 4 protein [Bacteroidales bacterium]